MLDNLTYEEKSAIRSLKRVAKKWPNSLWLFSASGTLTVMAKVNGERVLTYTGAMDPDMAVTTIDIENDGGDW